MRVKRQYFQSYLISSLLTFPVCSFATNYTVTPTSAPPTPVILMGGTTPDTLTVQAGGTLDGGAGSAVSIQNPPAGQASNNTITVSPPAAPLVGGIIRSQPAANHGVVDMVQATGGQGAFTMSLDGTLQVTAGGGSTNAIYASTTAATAATTINIGFNSPQALLAGDVFISIGNGQSPTVNFNAGAIRGVAAGNPTNFQMNGTFNFGLGSPTFTGSLAENGVAGQSLAVNLVGTPTITGQLGTGAHPITGGLSVGFGTLATGTYNLTQNSSATLTGNGITVVAPIGGQHSSINMSGTSTFLLRAFRIMTS